MHEPSDSPADGRAESRAESRADAERFEAERPRLMRLADVVLGDRAEAEDVVQQAWLRLAGVTTPIENLAGWLTTVTTRLCLDRLRQRVPTPVAPVDAELGAGGLELPDPEDDGDPLRDVVLADAVGTALHVVLDRLTPRERVAFVLHDTFAVDFDAIAAVLGGGTSPAAARKLASRARAKVTAPVAEEEQANAAVVDAFLAAARGGDLPTLLTLLAPGVVVSADAAAAALGTPSRLQGREEVAAFFNGAARGAMPVLTAGRPGLAWMQRGEVRMLFDLTVDDRQITAILFRAEPEVLAGVVRR